MHVPRSWITIENTLLIIIVISSSSSSRIRIRISSIISIILM